MEASFSSANFWLRGGAVRLSVSRARAGYLEGGDTHLPMKMWVQPCSFVRKVSTPSRSEAAHLKKSPKTRQKVADMMSAIGGPWPMGLLMGF